MAALKAKVGDDAKNLEVMIYQKFDKDLGGPFYLLHALPDFSPDKLVALGLKEKPDHTPPSIKGDFVARHLQDVRHIYLVKADALDKAIGFTPPPVNAATVA